MVHRVFPWLSRSLTCAAAVALMAGCGGGGSPAAPGPSPTPVPTPTPAPTPTATPDPRANLANGPVVNYRIKVRSIAPCHDIENPSCSTYRPKVQEPDGAWLVCRGDFLVLDGNQANAQGQECKWINDPVYSVTDPSGVFNRLGSTNPFFLRTDITAEGDVTVYATLDGIQSNVLKIRAKRNGCPAPEELAAGQEP
jgi:hypothetical protein